MKNQSFLLTLLGITAITGMAAEFKTDFKSDDIPGLKVQRRALIANGALKFSNGGSAELEFIAAKPVTIALRLRITQLLDSKNNPYVGIALNGKDGGRNLLMLRPDGVAISYFYQNNVRDTKSGFIRKYTFIKDEFLNVEYIVGKARVTLSINGEKIAEGRCVNLFPVTTLSFMTYSLEWELASIDLREMPEAEAPRAVTGAEEKK